MRMVLTLTGIVMRKAMKSIDTAAAFESLEFVSKRA